MRTQTQIGLTIKKFSVSENLYPDPCGFHIKTFLAASSAETRSFKVNGPEVKLNQTLKFKNITAKIIEIWLCTKSDKIIAIGSLNIKDGEGDYEIQLKMLDTEFGKLDVSLEVKNYQIEKQEWIEPDEQLLKKEEDPQEVIRKKQEEEVNARKQAQALQAAKAQKKPAITLTRFKVKQEPFI